MSDRSRIALSPSEVERLLATGGKMQLATINRDGTPHLVTMFFAPHQGRIAFWTYRSSQKARNLARDPRLTCLVEDGEDYFELRGVQVNGVAEPIEDPAGVAEIGQLIAAQLTGTPPATTDGDGENPVESYVARAALKRIAYLVRPGRVTSWDHRKLLT